MSKGISRVLYIPDNIDFKWCIEQESNFHIFLTDYAEYHDTSIDRITAEVKLKAYEMLQQLKDEGVTYISSYSGVAADMVSFIHYVLSDFIICSYESGGGGEADAVINLNCDKHKQKLLKLME